MFDAIDWEKLFGFDTPVLEIFLRGSFMYLGLLCLLRLILKRQSGSVGITDLLVIVLIADASQNAMAADYRSIPDGLLLVATIIFWNFVLEWLAYHFNFIEHFIHPYPLRLVQDGRLLPKNMKKELITERELMSQLREQGIESLRQVKSAHLEGDGKISVVKNERKKPSTKKSRAKKRKITT